MIAKVVLVGATGVGKTSILLRHNGQGYSTQISPTIGASFCKTEIAINGVKIQMQIWDTAGQERFRAMAPMYYRNTNAALIVYDITSKDSFSALRSWVEEIRHKVDQPIVMCIIGNKNDMDDRREVKAVSGREYADSVGALFVETSAMTNKGIEEAFRAVATQLIQNQLISESVVSRDSVASNDSDSYRSWRCC